MSDRAAGGAAPTVAPQATAVPEATQGAPVQADLRVAITPPYAENLLGWRVGGTTRASSSPCRRPCSSANYQTWEARPMLAESWEVSPDGKQWTIKLRENVPFHHGEDTSAFPTSCSASNSGRIRKPRPASATSGTRSWGRRVTSAAGNSRNGQGGHGHRSQRQRNGLEHEPARTGGSPSTLRKPPPTR